MGANNNQFRERFTEIGTGLKRDEVRKIRPSTEGLKLDTSFDISQLEDIAAPQKFEIKGVADKVKSPEIGINIDADLGKLDEGVRKIHEQQKNKQIQRWIEEAQQQIARKHYSAAMKLLDKAIKADPTSAQALYLQGYCFFALQRYKSAIEILIKAHQHAQNAEMVLNILILQAICTRTVTKQFEDKLQKLLAAQKHKQALSLITDELRQRPTDAALLYFKCGVLLFMGQVTQAKQTATDAMKRVDKENVSLFQELLDQIRLQEYQGQLEAVRQSLRKGNIKQAQNQLQLCQTALSGHKRYESIKIYIAERSSRGLLRSIFSRKKAEILTQPSLQELLLWLLSEEMNTGMSAMNKQRFAQAQVAFGKAEKIDNRCNIICFMHGLAIFKAFELSLSNSQSAALDLNKAINELSKAAELLNRAANDPVVANPSQNIRTVVESYRTQLQTVAQEREKQEREEKPINDLIQDFNALMESLQKGIGSLKDLQQAEKKFRDLRKRAQKIKKGRSSTQGTEVLSQMMAAFDRNLKQLDELRDEISRSQLAVECVTEFTTMMEYYKKHPISNQTELKNARSKVQNLKRKVSKAKAAQPRGSENLQVLNQLEKALNNMGRQLN